MKARLNSFQAAPKDMQALLDFSGHVQKSGLEHSLLCLIEMRASQINGCAFCLHMHAKDARAHDETEMRLYLLSAWRESPLYSERERAALAWTEAVTNVNNAPVSDTDFQALQAQFTPEEQVQLTLAITTINAWNRINVAFQTPHPKS
nr:carboxymuconolactone decarboxylase family protein [uncultured Dongia sp.]